MISQTDLHSADQRISSSYSCIESSFKTCPLSIIKCPFVPHVLETSWIQVPNLPSFTLLFLYTSVIPSLPMRGTNPTSFHSRDFLVTHLWSLSNSAVSPLRWGGQYCRQYPREGAPLIENSIQIFLSCSPARSFIHPNIVCLSHICCARCKGFVDQYPVMSRSSSSAVTGNVHPSKMYDGFKLSL